MSELPFHSGYDAIVIAAFWLTLSVLLASVVLFFYALGYRLRSVLNGRRRLAVQQRWRDVFSAAALSKTESRDIALPQFERIEQADLFHEWNLARETVRGDAGDNLNIIAGRMGLPGIARELMSSGHLQSRLMGMQTLGNVRDAASWEPVEKLLVHANTALSVTAASAMVNIDAPRAIERLMPMISQRRDWPRTRVSNFLRRAGSDVISEPLFRAIRGSKPLDIVYYLQFAELAESTVIDAIAEDLIRTSNDPAVLAGALRLISGHSGVPRIVALVHHDVWYVRMHAAKVLGRVGQPEHLGLLETLLTDTEWWVRYRAAQAISSLPFVGPNRLRQIKNRQRDKYASDMLGQVLAEVGLA